MDTIIAHKIELHRQEY